MGNVAAQIVYQLGEWQNPAFAERVVRGDSRSSNSKLYDVPMTDRVIACTFQPGKPSAARVAAERTFR